METERVTEFPIANMDRRPRKRARLGWDVLPPVPQAQLGLLYGQELAKLACFATMAPHSNHIISSLIVNEPARNVTPPWREDDKDGHYVFAVGDSLTSRWLDSSYSMGSTNGLVNATGKQPIFSFGIISDVQYADIPDGRSFIGVPRYYRHSIMVLQRAVRKWNNEDKHQFAINFGDIVDGFCPKEQSLSAVKKIVNEFEKFNGPVHHIVGNHCLYNLSRDKLIPLLRIPNTDGRGYYDFSPSPGYRFVILDGYDISAIGWPENHPNALKAIKFLQEKNPNTEKNSPEGLVGFERRFLKFNGAIGEEQMGWLNDILKDATKLDQRVVICCHLPLDPGASSREALLWNYDEVMDLIHRYNCVKVCISGHDHKGGHSVDSHGIHHRVLEAALECPPGTDAFGHIEVFDDKISLIGTDRMKSTDMPFNP